MKRDHIAEDAAIRIDRAAKLTKWVVLFLLLSVSDARIAQAGFDDPNIETRIEQYVQPPKNYLEERPVKKVRRCPPDGEPAPKHRLKKKQDGCRN